MRYWMLLLWFLPTLAFAVSLPPILVVDKENTPVNNVVVILPYAHAMKKEKQPMAIVDQINRRFVPHVSVVKTNTYINFPNSDDTRHHVYSFSPAKEFELKLYRKNEAPPIIFDKEGIVTLGCNIHDSMLAYIYVTDEEVFTVSDEQGIAKLPPFVGAMPNTLLVWHPQMKKQKPFVVSDIKRKASHQKITVSLPFKYEVPKASKGTSSLSDRLKRYKRDEK